MLQVTHRDLAVNDTEITLCPLSKRLTVVMTAAHSQILLHPGLLVCGCWYALTAHVLSSCEISYCLQSGIRLITSTRIYRPIRVWLLYNKSNHTNIHYQPTQLPIDYFGAGIQLKFIVENRAYVFLCFHFNFMQKFRFQYQFEDKGIENNFGPSVKLSDKKN